MLLIRRILLAATLVGAGCNAAPPNSPERIQPNDNRVAAGKLRNGVLTVHLEAREGLWYPDADDGPSLPVQTFAEVGHGAQNPGPLIRVPSGTTIRLSLHSALKDSVLVVYGLHTRPSTTDDTIHVAPGATRELSFSAGEPGTYFYWGTTTQQSVDNRNGIDSQLHGAFIIDPPGVRSPKDRVFVLGDWSGPVDSALGYEPGLRVINGVSWPHTERFEFTVGDTVTWRWVNPSDSPHPIHLHGFYFDVTTRGTWAADTTIAAPEQPHVVTNMPLSGGTFTMRWVPTEPGNWLVHCHVAYHTSMYLSAKVVPDPEDPVVIDPMHGMKGMVLAVHVRPRAGIPRRPTVTVGARDIRLIAQAAPKRFYNELDGMAFVEQQGTTPPAPDSVPMPSSPLLLRRNEPVRITIVNHTRAPTGVHWHGIEVPSYSDGVPNWSGSGNQLAPVIAPGDSFVAAFTPTRSGTFIYHAHSNEQFQISMGLYGALLVVDDPAKYDPVRERVILMSPKAPNSGGFRINGRLVPDTLRLEVGTTYRLRLIHMVADFTTRVALLRGDSILQWKALAKDGAELPASLQTMRPAMLIAGPGETMDFEYRPTEPGLLRFLLQRRAGSGKLYMPIRVVGARQIAKAR